MTTETKIPTTQLELEEQMLDLGESKFRLSIGGNKEFDSPHIQKIVRDIVMPFTEIIATAMYNANNEKSCGPKHVLAKLSEKHFFINVGTKKNKKTGEVIDLDPTVQPVQIAYIVIREIFIGLRECAARRMTSTAISVGKMINSNILPEQQFKENAYVRIGSLLINLLVLGFPKWFETEENNVGQLSLPLKHFDGDSKNKEYLIIPTPEFLSLCEDTIEGIAEMAAVIYPMIEKPHLWSEFGRNGGFYSEQLKKNIIKKRGLNEHSGINPLIARAVNAVAQTPWTVNKEVLSVVDILNNVKDLHKSDIGKLSKTFPETVGDTPDKPYGDLAYSDMDDNQKPEHIKWIRKAKKLHKDRQAKKSIDISREASLGQGKKFQVFPKIYFPHNLDYRERLYNMCMTGLNTQGSDVQKGLIKFATPRQVKTESGIRWMKINMANLMGFDKKRLDVRVQLCDEHEQIIRDVVKNPITCTAWHHWDKPLQGLAAAMEYVKWLDNDQAFLNTHVQLDGLCNGVQNLAAITRDHNVAPHVGLVYTYERGDVYQFVCDDVIKKINGSGTMATEWLESKLMDRGLTKTPVMTRAYSAKLYGIKEGIQDYIDEKNMADFFVDSFKAGNFMGEQIWDSMDMVLSGPMQLMNWVKKCAGIMAKANLPLIWNNPVNGICIQSPMTTKRKTVKVIVNGKRIDYIMQTPTGIISKPKSESSSAPNMTHSCDGAHLTRTTDICLDADIHEFAMVHDSFGTAPDDAETLLHSAKHAWVKNYGGDRCLPQEWYEQWIQQGLDKGITLSLPKPEEFITFGTLKAEEVVSSEFFFA